MCSSPPFHPDQLSDLTNKTYIVTGGTSGIGYHTAARLYEHNARVYICSRTPSKGETAKASIETLYPNVKGQLEILIMNHGDLSTVVAAAKTFLSRETALHGLINNAGVMACPFEITKDGYEVQWQTNYLAHWVFTHHLLPLLQQTATSSTEKGSVRIVNVASSGHTGAPKGGIKFEDTSMLNAMSMTRYGQSKLANILHAKALHETYYSNGKEGSRIWINSLHPGIVKTNLGERATEFPMGVMPILKLWGKLGGGLEADQGAWTSLFAVAGSGAEEGMSGRYLVPVAKVGSESTLAKDAELARKLENWAEEEMRRAGWIE